MDWKAILPYVLRALFLGGMAYANSHGQPDIAIALGGAAGVIPSKKS